MFHQCLNYIQIVQSFEQKIKLYPWIYIKECVAFQQLPKECVVYIQANAHWERPWYFQKIVPREKIVFLASWLWIRLCGLYAWWLAYNSKLKPNFKVVLSPS